MPAEDLVLVASASGKTGIPTVAALRERGTRVRALVHGIDQRAEQLQTLGAEVVQGDLLDFHDVSSAVAGASGTVTAAGTFGAIAAAARLPAPAALAKAATARKRRRDPSIGLL